MDVYAETRDKEILNFEMQNQKNELLARSQYYGATMISDSLKKGKEYSNTKKVLVIFICSFDPFDEEEYRYDLKLYRSSSQGAIKECRSLYQGIFFNIYGKKGSIQARIKEYLDYVADTTEEKALKTKNKDIKIIHEEVMKILFDYEFWREKMSLHFMLEDKLEEGMEKGTVKTLQILKLFKSGKTVAELAKKFKLTEKKIKKIVEVLN